MSNSTFSGPIRAGTQATGASSNVGVVILAQSATIPTAAILLAPAAVPLFTIPAGAKLLEFDVEVLSALATATNCSVTIGTLATANYFVTTFSTGTAIGKVSPATIATAMLIDKTNNVTAAADLTIYATPTAVTASATAGSLVVTCKYLQRSPAGSYATVA